MLPSGIVIDRWGVGCHHSAAQLLREMKLQLCRLVDNTPPVRVLGEAVLRLQRPDGLLELVQGMQVRRLAVVVVPRTPRHL